MKNFILTKNEENVLYVVCKLQNEEGHSEYTSVKDCTEKGILGSLVKKGLVYDCYDGVYTNMGYMYCLTTDGVNVCKELGIKTDHIHFFNL
jgi:hypothetical protein